MSATLGERFSRNSFRSLLSVASKTMRAISSAGVFSRQRNTILGVASLNVFFSLIISLRNHCE